MVSPWSNHYIYIYIYKERTCFTRKGGIKAVVYLNISDFYLPRGVVFKLNNRNLLDECRIKSHLRKAGRL